MTVSANPCLFPPNPIYRRAALLVVWCCGLVLGCSIYEPLHLSLMRSAVIAPVSIIGVFVCVYLPLIISYFSLLTDKPVVTLIVCFIKAVSFGYAGQLVFRYFYSAAWLVRLLFLFSDCLHLLILLYLLLHYTGGRTKELKRDFLFAAIVSTLFALVDLTVVQPFLKGLF